MSIYSVVFNVILLYHKPIMSTSLRNLTVLVTRPAHQAGNLCVEIERHAGRALLFPTVAIVDVPQASIHKTVQTLTDYAMVIFLSPNAVYKVIEQIRQYWPRWPTTVHLIAIGATTAQLLRNYYPQHSIICPSSPFNTERLLAMLSTQSLRGQSVLLIQGEGGRTLLADTLRQWGVWVTQLSVYRRVLAQPSVEEIANVARAPIDVIIGTNGSGIKNLIILLHTQHFALLDVQLLVASARIAHLSRDLGFRRPALIAENATDAALMRALLDWRGEKTWI